MLLLTQESHDFNEIQSEKKHNRNLQVENYISLSHDSASNEFREICKWKIIYHNPMIRRAMSFVKSTSGKLYITIPGHE